MVNREGFICSSLLSLKGNNRYNGILCEATRAPDPSSGCLSGYQLPSLRPVKQEQGKRPCASLQQQMSAVFKMFPPFDSFVVLS